MPDHGPYTGGIIIWRFQSEDERIAYEQCRKAYHVSRQSSGCLMSVVVVFFLSPWGPVGIYVGALMLFFLLVFSALPFLQRGYFEGRYGLGEVHLKLHPGRLLLDEKFGEKTVLLGSVRAKAVNSAQWLNDGCWLEVGAWNVRRRRYLIPQGFFQDQECTAQFQRWAKHHDIEIDGVPPLGFYKRPIRTGGMS